MCKQVIGYICTSDLCWNVEVYAEYVGVFLSCASIDRKLYVVYTEIDIVSAPSRCEAHWDIHEMD